MNLFEKWKFGNYIRHLSISKIDTLSGQEFEEFIADYFCYLGFKTVLTPPSGDNGIDIIASKGSISIGIQAKLYYNHNVGNKAVQEVFSGKNYYKLTHAIVITNWTFSKPALTLANSLNVLTIGRQELTNLLKNSRKENINYINTLLDIK